jgi:hypothetical protein
MNRFISIASSSMPNALILVRNFRSPFYTGWANSCRFMSSTNGYPKDCSTPEPDTVIGSNSAEAADDATTIECPVSRRLLTLMGGWFFTPRITQALQLRNSRMSFSQRAE